MSLTINHDHGGVVATAYDLDVVFNGEDLHGKVSSGIRAMGATGEGYGKQ